MNKLKKFCTGKAGIMVMSAFAVLILASWVSVDSLSKSYKKKINKTIVELWSQELELRDFKVSDSSTEKLEQVGVLAVFSVQQEMHKVGYAVLAKARSKFEDFEYMVYYDQNKTIKAVRVMLYREDYGGEIASKRWLKQFTGKTANSPITIDNDIQGISGATISYRAITLGVKEITLLMQDI